MTFKNYQSCVDRLLDICQTFQQALYQAEHMVLCVNPAPDVEMLFWTYFFDVAGAKFNTED